MKYLSQGSQITIKWTIINGHNDVTEDFSKAKVMMFLYHGLDRYLVPCTTERGVVTGVIADKLPEAVYDVALVWIKNDGVRFRNPPKKFVDKITTRCVSRARVNEVLAITEDETLAENKDNKSVVLSLKSRVLTYAYDGLDMYELGVLKGLITYDEEEWIEYVKNIPQYLADVKQNMEDIAALAEKEQTDVDTLEDRIKALTDISAGLGSDLIALKSELPTKVSDLENDVPFTEQTDHDALKQKVDGYDETIVVDDSDPLNPITETVHHYGLDEKANAVDVYTKEEDDKLRGYDYVREITDEDTGAFKDTYTWYSGYKVVTDGKDFTIITPDGVELPYSDILKVTKNFRDIERDFETDPDSTDTAYYTLQNGWKVIIEPTGFCLANADETRAYTFYTAADEALAEFGGTSGNIYIFADHFTYPDEDRNPVEIKYEDIITKNHSARELKDGADVLMFGSTTKDNVTLTFGEEFSKTVVTDDSNPDDIKTTTDKVVWESTFETEKEKAWNGYDTVDESDPLNPVTTHTYGINEKQNEITFEDGLVYDEEEHTLHTEIVKVYVTSLPTTGKANYLYVLKTLKPDDEQPTDADADRLYDYATYEWIDEQWVKVSSIDMTAGDGIAINRGEISADSLRVVTALPNEGKEAYTYALKVKNAKKSTDSTIAYDYYLYRWVDGAWLQITKDEDIINLVSELPEEGNEGELFVLKSEVIEKVYDEETDVTTEVKTYVYNFYAWVTEGDSGTWHNVGTIGSTDTDLTNYYTKTQIAELLEDYVSEKVVDEKDAVLDDKITALSDKLALKQDALNLGDGLAWETVEREIILDDSDPDNIITQKVKIKYLTAKLDSSMYVIIDSLDEVTDPDPNKVYLIYTKPVYKKDEDGKDTTEIETDGYMTQYRYKDNEWVVLGTANGTVDLSGYVTQEQRQEDISLLKIITEKILG